MGTEMNKDLELVTYCGLYCELCAGRARIPRRAAARYSTLIADNRRLQAVGLDQWLDEQQERAGRGFVYADIRYRVNDVGDAA